MSEKEAKKRESVMFQKNTILINENDRLRMQLEKLLKELIDNGIIYEWYNNGDGYHWSYVKIESEVVTIEQNAGENRIEGGVVSISGSVNIPDIKRECKTCRNPYCSRTLEERQNIEVQAHWQYGWECEDKEKWLSHSGGFEFIKKEKK